MTKFIYEEIPEYSREEALAAAQRNVSDELRRVVIGIALYHPDRDFIGQFCWSLATHSDECVRGNAVLGLGYLAQRFEQLDEMHFRPIIEAALVDESQYVRGQAWAAADDISHALGWKIAGFK